MARKGLQAVLVAAVALLALAGVALMSYLQPQPELRDIASRVEKIEAISAQLQSFTPTVNTQGVVESRLTISLKAQAAGQVVYTSDKFLAGGFFQRDELILQVDPRDYELALVEAQVTVATAEQTLSKERELSRLAFVDWQQYSKAQASDLVLRIPQLREAEAGVKGARANYERARIRLSRTEVRAPFELMIDRKQVDQGQVVSDNQALAAVFGTEQAEVRMPLSQQQMDLLQLAEIGILGPSAVRAVTIRDPSRDGDNVWSASLDRVEASLDRKSRVYYAIATVRDPLNLRGDRNRVPLLPGVFVDLEVAGKKIKHVFRVPIRAMRDDNNIYLFENNQLITRRVTVLARDRETVTIVAGLQPGDIVCVSPPWSYVAGMKAQLAMLDGIAVDEQTLSAKGRRAKIPVSPVAAGN